MIEPITSVSLGAETKKTKTKKKKPDFDIEVLFDEPKFTCISCKHRNDDHCRCFNRDIELDINKCKYHSTYSPLLVVFKVMEDLDKIIEQEKKKCLTI